MNVYYDIVYYIVAAINCCWILHIKNIDIALDSGSRSAVQDAAGIEIEGHYLSVGNTSPCRFCPLKFKLVPLN